MILILLSISPFVVAFILYYLTQYSRFADGLQGYKGLAPPFFVPLAAMFALFAIFLTNDIWIRAQDRAVELERSLEHEIGALRVIQRIALKLEEDGREIAAAVRDYIAASNAEGWHASGREAAGALDRHLQSLLGAILDRPRAADNHAVIARQLLEMYATVERARAERVTFQLYEADIYKWAGVMILGFLTQAAVAMVHVDARKPQAASLFLFSLAFCVTILIIGISENHVLDAKHSVLEVTIPPQIAQQVGP